MHVVLVNPRAQKAHRRLPLSVLFVARNLGAEHTWEIVDANIDGDAARHAEEAVARDPANTVVLVTVMPGPQLRWAVPFSRALKAKFPRTPIVWGGYFATVYPEAVAKDEAVDVACIGQGEITAKELVDTIAAGGDPVSVAGTAVWRDGRSLEGARARLRQGIELRRSAVRTAADGSLRRAHVPRATHVQPPHQLRLPLLLQLLCGREHVRGALAPRSGGARRAHRAAAPRSLRRRRDRVPRQQLLRVGEAHVRFRARDRGARGPLVGRGADRHDARLGVGDLGGDGAERPRDGVLRRRVGGRRSAGGDGQGRAHGEGHARPQPPRQELRRRARVLVRARKPQGSRGRHRAHRSRSCAGSRTRTPRARSSSTSTRRCRSRGSTTRREKQGFEFPATLDEWLSPRWYRYEDRRNPGTPWLTPRMVRRVYDFEAVLHARFPTVPIATCAAGNARCCACSRRHGTAAGSRNGPSRSRRSSGCGATGGRRRWGSELPSDQRPRVRGLSAGEPHRARYRPRSWSDRSASRKRGSVGVRSSCVV